MNPRKLSLRHAEAICAIALALLFCFCLPARSAQKTANPNVEADTAAIKQVLADFTDAWNRGDARAMAALFAEDADFTNYIGTYSRGRAEIEKFLVNLLGVVQKGSHHEDNLARVRFLSPQFASAEDAWVLTNPKSNRPHREGLFNLLMVKQGGTWRILESHASDFPDASAGAPSQKVGFAGGPDHTPVFILDPAKLRYALLQSVASTIFPEASRVSEQVTVVAKMRAKRGQESRARELLQGLLGPTRAESGCLNYDLHESPGDPGEFLFHENWASAAQLDAHLQSPHIRAAFAVAPEVLEGMPEITRWRRLR